MSVTLDAAAFRRWSRACVEALGEARAEIDALNVFPVPDSDTGTNAYLTFVAADDAVKALPADARVEVCVRAHVDALLTGARGNSGVILSQLVRAYFREAVRHPEPSAADVARCFELAADAAWAAVARPVEGTILSVARAAADGATAAAASGTGVRETFATVAREAREALARTPQQLDRLAAAGVVDSGGRALVVVLDTTEQVMTGRYRGASPAVAPLPVPQAGDLVEGGPAYEVMYLLQADDAAVATLRTTLDGLGDSLVVVGGDGLWNVHVHVDDVGAAIEAGITAGRPYRVRVTHFADQRAAPVPQRQGRMVLAATTGDGLGELAASSGAVVLPFTREQPLDVDRMRKALTSGEAAEVVVLPNNVRYVSLFEAAAREAREAGVRVAIIPTHAQVQGLAALAVHDPGRPFDDDVVAMSSAAAHVQHGALTIAAEAAMTMAGPCEAGDVLGVVQGDFALVGDDPVAIGASVVDQLLAPSAELLTLVLGAGADDGLADALCRHVRRVRPDVDTVIYTGGQEHYPLFVSVE
ncbi:DAK2 domain-containing protein [Aeromicrobium sp. IC_218]|uniref:DAK2 domain-containing protein n=1 Tax=Aeromicrobium sp. IC_218 TaxID=2545468 RepID=UPI00103DFC60|nr:DAK2 domain-containing protein [Aeromicrobium sp. IC_218]TCI96753.1 DAK2 domain-containing protein [Aeromicrobium sp. IC_218]